MMTAVFAHVPREFRDAIPRRGRSEWMRRTVEEAFLAGAIPSDLGKRSSLGNCVLAQFILPYGQVRQLRATGNMSRALAIALEWGLDREKEDRV